MPKEQLTPVETYMARLICDCGGEMKATSGPQLMSDPPKIPHECDRCGAMQYVRGKAYPHVVHKEPTGLRTPEQVAALLQDK